MYQSINEYCDRKPLIIVWAREFLIPLVTLTYKKNVFITYKKKQNNVFYATSCWTWPKCAFQEQACTLLIDLMDMVFTVFNLGMTDSGGREGKAVKWQDDISVEVH